MDVQAYIQSDVPKKVMMSVLVKQDAESFSEDIYRFIDRVFQGSLMLEDFAWTALEDLDPEGSDEFLTGLVYDVYSAVFGEYEDELEQLFEQKKKSV